MALPKLFMPFPMLDGLVIKMIDAELEVVVSFLVTILFLDVFASNKPWLAPVHKLNSFVPYCEFYISFLNKSCGN